MVGGGEGPIQDRPEIAPSSPAAARRRIEIVHESLLTKWPRLVRWRAQDEEGAVLRDQLRQAALVWDQHGRAEDFLWTGTAFREYELWRERYPGRLTDVEQAFGKAMTDLAGRRRRRRRAALAGAFALLIGVLAAISLFWRLSETSRQRAEAETLRAEGEARRAEASKLIALGQLALEANPTAALAHAIRSLELADSWEARIFAVQALAAGPPATVLPLLRPEVEFAFDVVFSPDGGWAALKGVDTIEVVSRDGRRRLALEPLPSSGLQVSVAFDPAGEHLYASKDGRVRVWSVPGFDLLETQSLEGTPSRVLGTRAGVLALIGVSEDPVEARVSALSPGAPPREIDRLVAVEAGAVDPGARWVARARDRGLFVRPLGNRDEPWRQIGTYEGRPWILFHPAGDRVALHDAARDEIRLWAIEPAAREPAPVFSRPLPTVEISGQATGLFTFDPAGRRLAAFGQFADGRRVHLWDFDAPASAEARSFPASLDEDLLEGARFSPDGRWLATANAGAACFWPLARREPRVLAGHRAPVGDLELAADGARLLSVDRDGEVVEWALHAGGASRPLARGGGFSNLALDRRERFFVVPRGSPTAALVVPSDGGEPRMLEGFDWRTYVARVAIDTEGRRVAAGAFFGPAEDKVIRVWDLDSGEVRVLGPAAEGLDGPQGRIAGLAFLPDGSLLSSGDGGLRRWSLATGSHEVVAPSFELGDLAVFPEGARVAHVVGTRASRSLAVTDLATKATTVLRSHGDRVRGMAVDPTGTVVATTDDDGIVRVGPVSGEEPHLLVGHRGRARPVTFSPDGRWIASGGDDRSIRLWPMPDLAKPPLHSLPYQELLAKLKSLTNVRVIEDAASPTGYKLDVGPFPGWAEAPEW